MGGGLMQLVAYGAQDIYLTGNPQITFFKVVYRRHTNFSMESIEQTFNGTATACSRVTATISRNGDLVHKMYIRVVNGATNLDCDCSAKNIVVGSCAGPTCPIPVIPDSEFASGAGVNNQSVCANDIVDSIEVEIGGQKIDKHYGDWLNIWTELTTPASKAAGTEELLNLEKGKYSYVPLQFWFNRNPGLALPLIALQYHEVKVNIDFAKANSSEMSCGGGRCEKTPKVNAWNNAKLFVDYIYLDTDERRRFAQVSHEYLIEQLQFTGTENIGATAKNKSVRLNFNHPVKELIWRATGMSDQTRNNLQRSGASGVNPIVGWTATSLSGTHRTSDLDRSSLDNFFGDTSISGLVYAPVYQHNPYAYLTSSGVGNVNAAFSGETPVCASAQWADITLQLNGHERFAPRHSEYFRLVQPLQHHTAIPVMSGIHVYSFALKPEEHQPSGTCNFSRIDNAVLKLNGKSVMSTAAGEGSVTMTNAALKVYAVNYNVLRIMSGMGGLAYSN